MSSIKVEVKEVIEIINGYRPFLGDNGEVYVEIIDSGQKKIVNIFSDKFQSCLQAEILEEFERLVPGQQIIDILGIVSNSLIGPPVKIGSRVLKVEGNYFLNLANDKGESVKVNPSGWKIGVFPEAKFEYQKSMGPIEWPIRSNNDVFRDFFDILNLRPEDDGPLAICWLLSALHPMGPYLVLAINGAQGSGKTVASEEIRKVIDPNRSLTRSFPASEEGLYIMAQNSWVACFENVSRLGPTQADWLCRLATGSGFSKRTLYKNTEETLISCCRPVLLNGLDFMMNRPDLADRSLNIRLEPLGKELRTREEIIEDLDYIRPRLLGRLLDGISVALEGGLYAPKTRMADAEKWIYHAAEGLGLGGDKYVGLMIENRQNTAAEYLQSNILAQAIIRSTKKETVIDMTASELLDYLNMHYPQFAKSKFWPQSPLGLSSQLNRLAANLQQMGIEIQRPPRSSNRRPIILKRVINSSHCRLSVTP